MVNARAIASHPTRSPWAGLLLVGALWLALLAVAGGGHCKPTSQGGGGGGTAPAGAPVDRQLVRSVCNNDKLPIERVSKMLEIIYFVQQDDTRVCRSRYISSLEELDPILKTPPEALCSAASFERLRDYHRRFIQPLRHLNRLPTQFEPLPRALVKQQLHPEPAKYTAEFDEHNQIIMVPIAVRHFFLAYALQLSLTCKRNLLENLLAGGHADSLLTDDDRDIMLLFDRGTVIGEALAKGYTNMNFDNVLYIRELDGLANRPADEEAAAGAGAADGDAEKKTHLQTTAGLNSSLFTLILACKNRFKPIYDQLLMPIIRLSKLGYDYRGKELGQEEQRRLDGPELKKWLGIVHVCELFENSLVLDGTNSTSASSNQTAAAAASGEHEGELVELDAREADELEHNAKRLDIIRPIEYRAASFAALPDELAIKSAKQLDYELSLKPGNRSPFGFRGFLRRAASALKKGLAKLDVERFAHYRRHSLWYSGVLNFISSCSNVASITITILSTAGVLG